MTTKDDGGPAYPTSGKAGYMHDAGCGDKYAVRSEPGSPGMSLRDAFAIAALQGILADSGRDGTPDDYARDAYRYADAMLIARAKP